MPNQKLDKISKMLELLSNDTVTPSKLDEVIGRLAKVVKDARANLDNVTRETKVSLNNIVNYIDKEHTRLLNDVSLSSKETDEKLSKKLDKSIKEMKAMCEVMMMEKPQDGKTPEKGKDYFTDTDINEVISKTIKELKTKKKLTTEDIEGLDKLLKEVGELGVKEAKGILALLPKNPPMYGGGSGATFIKSMRDIINTKTATDGQALVKRGKEFAFETISGTGAVDSVNGQTGVVVLDADDISDTSTTNKFTNATDISRLANTSGTNTGDQDLSGLALKSNVLELNNTTPFTPDADYEPATKKYVDDNAGGASTFLDLTDTPADYTDDAGKGVRVNATADGLEFYEITSGTDEKVKFDASDPTAGYVADKIVAGTGISVAEGTAGNENKLVITNSNPDQTVSITDSGIATVTGTYPNFNIDVPATDLSGYVPTSRTVAGKALSSDVTIALDDLSDTTIATPLVDQVLKYNGSAWVNGNETTVNAGSGVDFFYVEAASDITGYSQLLRTPDSGGELDETVVVNNNKVLINEYASPSTGLGGTKIDAGIWTFDIWAYVDVSLSGSSSIEIDIYKRTAGGVETLLFTVNSGSLMTSLGTEPNVVSTVQPEFSINATDRLVAKVYGKNTASVNRTVHFFHGGTTHYSHFNTPLVVRHNDLAGLQGGTSGEYNHLTNAQLTDLGVTKVVANGAITGATKTKITYDEKGLVTAGADATTADIADSFDKRYVTEAQLTVIGNTSNTNTGDNATNTTSNSYADGKVEDSITDGVTTKAPSENAVFDALALKAPIANPTFTGTVTFPTGSTTVAPIKMVAGTNLTTPVAGVIEFDGTDFYISI